MCRRLQFIAIIHIKRKITETPNSRDFGFFFNYSKKHSASFKSETVFMLNSFFATENAKPR